MAMSTFSLCFLLLCCSALNDAWLTGPRCDSKKDCVSCTKHKSWSGQPCRWCPRDNECHSHGAVLANPCSTSENIVSPTKCSQIVVPRYDKNLAYKMVFLSALAYADNVAKYISKASEVKSFQLVHQVTKTCQANAKCSGFVAVSHTERAIAVAFRGSETTNQVLVQGLKILTVPKVRFSAGGNVQKTINDEFNKIWSELKNDVYRQIASYGAYKVWVTGHSLGGAMASLASTLIRNDEQTTRDNLILYTFGQPRVGDHDYASKHDKLVPISFRVTRYRDLVVQFPTCVPPTPIPCFAYGGGPYHHGKEIYYGGKVMMKDSSYTVCGGLPHNEDMNCSYNPANWGKCLTSDISDCIDSHTTYFGIRVGLWWKQ